MTINVSKYLGIPYREEGKKVGMNCAELVYTVMRNEFGLVVPDTDLDGSHAATHFLSHLSLWHECEPKPGCMVVFKVGVHMHCGVMINNREFLHILKGRNAAIEKVSARMWVSRVDGYYEYINNK